jgi:hypothetical protein
MNVKNHGKANNYHFWGVDPQLSLSISSEGTCFRNRLC